MLRDWSIEGLIKKSSNTNESRVGISDQEKKSKCSEIGNGKCTVKFKSSDF